MYKDTLQKVKRFMTETEMLQNCSEIILGVSGGPDSMTMLHILNELRDEFGYRLRVVHVNHGIRGKEALRDQQMVEKICSEWKIPCAVYNYDVPALALSWKMGTEEAGRKVRRIAFEKEKENAVAIPEQVRVALAHNQNDMAETMLHHLARGTGIRGLCSLKPLNGEIIRPLLCLERSEIVNYVEENSIQTVLDSSNMEDDYTRNRIRRHILPLIEQEVNPRAVTHMAEASEIFEQAESYFTKLAGEMAAGYRKAKDRYVLDHEFFKKETIIHTYVIREILEESVQKFGEVKAVKWLNRKEVLERSYSEMLRNVISIRKGLLAEDFAGKHIALIGTSSVEWIESYLGIITGCTTAVPLDAALPCEELIDLINRSDSEALFLSPKHRPYLEAFLANCPKLQKVWMLQEEVEDVPSGVYSINELRNTGISASADASCPAAEDIATIIFTSGTTGKSKGVMLTQNNLASNVEAVKISAEPGTAMLSVLPIHHAFCLVMDWLKGFSQGTTICINDSLLHMVRNMSIFKPDIMLMVPMMIETIYKRLSAADPQIPKAVLAEKVFGGKLQTIFTGGAHLDPYYIDRFAEYGVQILEGYGMSECSPVISNNTPENHKPGSIGRPLENVEIRFENGEILVKGTSVMKGYYQMPDETAETLKDGWLHTGDKGYMDEDGYLFINGRVKNLIILSNGENISPEEIENKLALNPLVGEVIVTGEDNGLTARIYPEQAVVEAKALDTEMIRSQLQEFLDEYNKNQPTYRRITGLVIRKNPFIRSTTKKIRRQDVLIDEPQA